MDDFTKTRIRRIMDSYTENKIPKQIQDELRLSYKIWGQHVTMIEERTAFMAKKRGEWSKLPFVQFRQSKEDGQWRVYWRDSKKKWHHVEDIPPSSDFETQLEIVDRDDLRIFWM